MNKLILILISLSVFLLSCRKPPAATTIPTPIIKKDTVLVMDEVCVKNIDFTSFSSKAKVEYNDGNTNISANLQIRIKKDSLIWLSGTMFGFEGIRAMVTKDSVWIINKIEKSYANYSIKDLGKNLNINLTYEIIEAILVGNAPIKQQLKDKVTRQENFVILNQKDRDLTIDNQINNKSCKLEKLDVKQNEGFGNAAIVYSEFNLLNDMFFAYNNDVKINYIDQTGAHKTHMVINHNKVDLNDKNLRFPFNIPNRYERK